MQGNRLFLLAKRLARWHPLPSECLLCRTTLGSGLICTGCHYRLPHLYSANRCQQCQLVIASEARYCGHCLDHPPAFSRSYIPFAYELPISWLIQGFKYRHQLTSGKLLTQLLAEYLQEEASQQDDWQMPDVIIPTPVHWQRRWWRGFNHTEMLARGLAKRLELPYSSRLLQRHQRTQSQKGLARAERQRNLRQAFRLTPGAAQQLAGKRIALVDDVVTTTATARELSQLLLQAGAREVQLWALARTLEPERRTKGSPNGLFD